MADKSYKLTLSLSDGTTINAGTITAPQGPIGANGVTFIPSVSATGILSWTNDGGLANPSPISIKGPKGDDAVITESDVAGWGFTKNAGTITGIKMNGETKEGTSGVVDLGTVLTAHPGLVGGNLVQYDSTAQTLKDSGKKISDLATTSQVNAKYTKPSGGIPKTDLASDVQTSLGKADSALQAKDISGKANLAGGNTFSGVQTINAPTNVSGSEQTTMKVKTSNGGAIIFGKEGANSGTMMRLDQVDGTCRLRFRSSATAGAMVWEQPESGAQLYIDLGARGGDYHRVQFPSGAGTLALTSQIPDVSGKQDKLTAGSNISISGNTISATVPTDVVKYTAQTLTTAQKTQARSNIGAGTSSFSGSYNDLTNKPTIPTVNNGTLTIQKNGTTVATFSANQSGNATANIIVPTFSLSGTTLTITV